MRVSRILIATTDLAAGVSLIIANPTGAHTGPPTPKSTPTKTVLTTAVGAPFDLEVRNHTVLVADGGPGLIGKVQADQSVRAATGIAGPPSVVRIDTRKGWRH